MRPDSGFVYEGFFEPRGDRWWECPVCGNRKFAGRPGKCHGLQMEEVQ